MEFLIEDKDVEELYPITLSRAGFEIVIGGYNLCTLLKEYFPGCKIGYKTRDYLKKTVLRTCPCEKIDDKKAVVLSSRTVPSLKNMKRIEEGKGKLDLLKHPFDIITWNKKICKDNLKFKSRNFGESEGVFLGMEVTVSEYVIFDASEGPIILDDNSVVLPFSYIKGPTYIGKDTSVREHSSIKEACIMNNCKVGGEIEESIIMPYSNKQHFGFLGNSFVGSWVNIGAGTTNSDLKNTYGKINIINGKNKKIKTNEQFLGCIIGDFSKTSINTSIFTGKTIGVNSSVGGLVDENIGSFILFNKDKREFLLKKALETQKRMFKRRNIEQKEEDINILTKTFEITKKDRENTLTSLKNRK